MAEKDPFQYFHAEGTALTGRLTKPFEAQIKKQAFVKLEGDSRLLLLEGDDDDTSKLRERKAPENYLSQHSKNYRLESVFSYSAAHTQVSGHRSKKHPDRFVTLATSTVENLNVLNVVTADRVVAQISTTHRPGQYSPDVTFLGTHFENLRIARHKTEPFVNLDFAGKAPNGQHDFYPTEATKKNGLMASVERQFQKLRDGFAKIKAELEPEYFQRLEKESWDTKQYHKFSDFDYQDLQKCAAGAAASNGPKWDGVTCSLVEHVNIENIEIPVKDAKPIEIPPPARCFGHVIHVPEFGTIFLAELKVNHNSFHLTMIRLELGCIADGSASVATCSVNGTTGKGGGG